MTTHTLTHIRVPARREARRPLTITGEHVASIVTAIAFVLLLPGASLLMSVLTA